MPGQVGWEIVVETNGQESVMFYPCGEDIIFEYLKTRIEGRLTIDFGLDAELELYTPEEFPDFLSDKGYDLVSRKHGEFYLTTYSEEFVFIVGCNFTFDDPQEKWLDKAVTSALHNSLDFRDLPGNWKLKERYFVGSEYIQNRNSKFLDSRNTPFRLVKPDKNKKTARSKEKSKDLKLHVRLNHPSNWNYPHPGVVGQGLTATDLILETDPHLNFSNVVYRLYTDPQFVLRLASTMIATTKGAPPKELLGLGYQELKKLPFGLDCCKLIVAEQDLSIANQPVVEIGVTHEGSLAVQVSDYALKNKRRKSGLKTIFKPEVIIKSE